MIDVKHEFVVTDHDENRDRIVVRYLRYLTAVGFHVVLGDASRVGKHIVSDGARMSFLPEYSASFLHDVVLDEDQLRSLPIGVLLPLSVETVADIVGKQLDQ